MEIQGMAPSWKVNKIKQLSDASYILSFDRNNLKFRPGQHLVAGLPGTRELREYSIYSGTANDKLELLIREVEDGKVSKKLKDLSPGEELQIKGPFGFFLYNAINYSGKKFLFLASGTGIAPFHSFISSYPEADYTLIHGIRTSNEAYGKEDYREGRYISCTSRDEGGDYHGRLTTYLRETTIDTNSMVYLCGNSNMIHEAIEILKDKNIAESNIYTEVYF